jgi:hypothetical protein
MLPIRTANPADAKAMNRYAGRPVPVNRYTAGETAS